MVRCSKWWIWPLRNPTFLARTGWSRCPMRFPDSGYFLLHKVWRTALFPCNFSWYCEGALSQDVFAAEAGCFCCILPCKSGFFHFILHSFTSRYNILIIKWLYVKGRLHFSFTSCNRSFTVRLVWGVSVINHVNDWFFTFFGNLIFLSVLKNPYIIFPCWSCGIFRRFVLLNILLFSSRVLGKNAGILMILSATVHKNIPVRHWV